MQHQSALHIARFSVAIVAFAALFMPTVPAHAGLLYNESLSGSISSAGLGLGTAQPVTVVATIIALLLGLLGLIFLILVLYAGFIWMTASGNEEKVKKGRDILIWSAIGLAIILSSYLIGNYVFSKITSATGIATGSDIPNEPCDIWNCDPAQ